MAMGGGGSTYITDYNSNFYNPANLFIKDKPTTVGIGFLTSGAYFNPILSDYEIKTRHEDFLKYLNPYVENEFIMPVMEDAGFMDFNYPRKRLSSIHQVRLESTLFGIYWKRENNAMSLAMRTRTASNFEIGRHWFSNMPVKVNETDYVNRSLKQSFQTLHEISFGYAETLSLLNDLNPRLQNIIIGIAPKLVLAGPFMNAKWDNEYTKNENEDNVYRIQSFEYDAVGSFSKATIDYLNGNNLQNVINNNFSTIENYLFDIHGIGAGVDVGLTYLLTFGDDFSVLDGKRKETNSSLRISLSVTDLGLVSYSDKGISYEAASDTSSSPVFNTRADQELFVGSQGQYLSFIDKYGESNPFMDNEYKNESFSVLLPTALHAGIMLEFSRFKLAGDVNYGLNDTAFNINKLITSLGVEIRPLKFLPLRGGIQMATKIPGYLSFGTGLETKHFELSLATQLSITTNGDITPLTGFTVAALQFHL